MPNKLCKYTCAIDKEVQQLHPELTQKDFEEKIYATFSDPRGWRKYGYTFEYKGSTPTTDKNTLHIVLVTGEKAKRMCGSTLGGFSCYAQDENKIYMNLDNWMGKSKSELPLDRYRTYVINHEVGHRLGFGHPTSQKTEYCEMNKGKRGSVMIQMTRGPDWVTPCVENEWPLDPGEYDETANPHLINLYPVEGASEKFLPALAVAGGGLYALSGAPANMQFVLIAIILIVFILWYCGAREYITNKPSANTAIKNITTPNVIWGLTL